MRRQAAISVISAFLILLWVYAAVSKMIDFNFFVYSLHESHHVEKGSTVAVVIIIIELFVAACLFWPKLNYAGLCMSAILLIGFTGYIIYMMINMPRLPCNCGGIIKTLSWRGHILLNVVFLLFAVTGIILIKAKKKYLLQ